MESLPAGQIKPWCILQNGQEAVHVSVPTFCRFLRHLCLLQAAHPEQQRADPAQNSWPASLGAFSLQWMAVAISASADVQLSPCLQVLTQFLRTLTQEQQTTLLLPLASPAPAKAPKPAKSRPVPGRPAAAVQAAAPQPALAMAPVVAPVAAAGPATPVAGGTGADLPGRTQTAAAVPAMAAAAGLSQPRHKRERAEPGPGAEQGTVHVPEAQHRKKARKAPQATRALAQAEAPQAVLSAPVPQRALANGHTVAAAGQQSAVSNILQESTLQEVAEMEVPIAEVLTAKLHAVSCSVAGQASAKALGCKQELLQCWLDFNQCAEVQSMSCLSTGHISSDGLRQSRA